MCLYAKKSFVAEKPIIIYKVGYEGGMLITPYQGTRIPFNRLYTDLKYTRVKHISQSSSIGRGYIHGFVDRKDAVFCAYYLTGGKYMYLGFLKVFTAIIPKGAIGYYGENDDICSNQIIVLNPNLPGYKEILSEYNIDESCV